MFNVDTKIWKDVAPQTIRFVSAEDSLTLEIEIVVPSDKFDDAIPALGSEYKGTIANVYGINKLILTGVEMNSLGQEDNFFRCRLTYSPPPLYDSSSIGVRRVFELNTEDIDVPLEQHSKYLMQWNHLLLARNGVTQIPSFWEQAKNPIGTGDNYQWALPGDAIPDGWYVMKAETKPGVSSFRAGVPTVTMIATSLSRSNLENEANSEDYRIKSPKLTFGYSGSWLRCGSSIRRNGRRWEMQTKFINSKVIDRDLYN